MIYFTDMLLIPADNIPPSELRLAMSGTGMVRCSQVENNPDLVLDIDRADAEVTESYSTKKSTGHHGPTPYVNEFRTKLFGLMNERKGDVEFDSDGAWGGPGGWDGAGGAEKYEPTISGVSGVTGDIPVIVKVISATGEPESAVDLINNEIEHLKGEGQKCIARHLEGTDLIEVSWDVDEDWEPEGSEADPDSYDDYDDPRSDYVYDPY